MGALEQMLVKLNSDPGRYFCGFRFELAISGTLLSMMHCYDHVRTYRMDDEGVPENVIVMKRIPVDEYITNLTNALANAKDAGLCHGRTGHHHRLLISISHYWKPCIVFYHML